MWPQVVQNLFDVMDMSRETYESLVEQKKELEELWKSEKDKSKVAQRVSSWHHSLYIIVV